MPALFTVNGSMAHYRYSSKDDCSTNDFKISQLRQQSFSDYDAEPESTVSTLALAGHTVFVAKLGDGSTKGLIACWFNPQHALTTSGRTKGIPKSIPWLERKTAHSTPLENITSSTATSRTKEMPHSQEMPMQSLGAYRSMPEETTWILSAISDLNPQPEEKPESHQLYF